MQMSTPPSASIMFFNPWKSTTAKYWMSSPVNAFTAVRVQLAAEARSSPVLYPMAKIELNSTPCMAGSSPLEVMQLGMSTMESRGMETRLIQERSAAICSTMVVSA